jgi:hypothetical protein
VFWLYFFSCWATLTWPIDFSSYYTWKWLCEKKEQECQRQTVLCWILVLSFAHWGTVGKFPALLNLNSLIRNRWWWRDSVSSSRHIVPTQSVPVPCFSLLVFQGGESSVPTHEQAWGVEKRQMKRQIASPPVLHLHSRRARESGSDTLLLLLFF